jgi:hypothetical protein
VLENNSLENNLPLTLTISKDLNMKKFALSLATLVMGLVSLTTPAVADRGPPRRGPSARPPAANQSRPRPLPPIQAPTKGGNGGNATATGGNGGNATGTGSKGGDGGSGRGRD